MSNKFKGKITLDNGYVMVMDFNSITDIEELTGENAFEFINKVETGKASLSDIRNLYFVCLKRFQPDITIYEAGDVWSDYPDALMEVIKAATPAATSTKTDTVKKK